MCKEEKKKNGTEILSDENLLSFKSSSSVPVGLWNQAPLHLGSAGYN